MDTDSPTTPDTITLLKKAGLTESQAKGYLALIEHGQLTPVELAAHTGESRTNGYQICEKLEKLGLAAKKDGKKAAYTANHPSSIEALAEKRRKTVTRNEQDVKQGISSLIDRFYANTEMPGTRTLQGIDGIKEVYADTLREKQDIYLLCSIHDDTTLDYDFFANYRKQRAGAGIHTYALTPMTAKSHEHLSSGADAATLFHRTPLPEGMYTAPVEVAVYGDKVAIIAFGETQMATIIDSAPVADAMRQLFRALAATLTKH